MSVREIMEVVKESVVTPLVHIIVNVNLASNLATRENDVKVRGSSNPLRTRIGFLHRYCETATEKGRTLFDKSYIQRFYITQNSCHTSKILYYPKFMSH